MANQINGQLLQESLPWVRHYLTNVGHMACVCPHPTEMLWVGAETSRLSVQSSQGVNTPVRFGEQLSVRDGIVESLI